MKKYLKDLKKKRKGFTLIELIIVLAIIAIISAIAIPKFGNIQKDAKIKADVANGKNIASAVAAEISDGTIDVSSSAITISDLKSDSDPNAKAVQSYLQSIPIPQLDKTSNFEVIISTSGAITVNVKGGKFASDVEVYPTLSNSYK